MEGGQSHVPFFSTVQQLLLDWSVMFFVLLSMTIQVVLVVVGANRYRISRRSLNLLVWICYMGADFVATSALGSMIHYSPGEVIYAVWACMMMVHLGGPDTITAYSVPDNNLWKRHCFNLLYQGSIAAYVVYTSAVEGVVEKERNLFVAAALIFMVGVTKYGERAWALWLASPSQIETSVKPIYNFMKIEHALGLHVDESIPDDEIADVDKFRKLHEDHYQYIVAGEECFHEDDNSEDWSESVVTVKDVWEEEGEVVTDNYLLCVSHALFKMYKRRFVSLRFHEAALEKTRRFFDGGRFSEFQVFKILEMELKFVYDYLFSKSSGTAFSRWGMGMRVVNICVLGLCWFFIMRGLQETEDVLRGQRIVTYILMCVAVGLEGFQLGRIMISDWSMVWLICAKIRQSREDKWWSSCTVKLIRVVEKVVGRLRKAVGGKYCRNGIPQLSVIESCLSAGSYSYPVVRKLLRFLPFKDFIITCYITAVTASHIEIEFVDNRSKANLIYALSGGGFGRGDLTVVKGLVEDFEKEEEGAGWVHRILAMHVATAVCEKLDESNVSYEARWLSRYFAYLVVTCPNILPVEVENAKDLCREVFREMMGKMAENKNENENDFCNNFKHSEWEGSLSLRIAKRLVTQWLESPERQPRNYWTYRWRETLNYCCMYDKSAVHGERLTVGGEFLTQMWALYGHVGLKKFLML